MRTWWKFQDTSSTSLIYYDPSENGETYNTIRTLTPPAGQVTAIPSNFIGEAYAKLEGEITINKQKDISGYGFVWSDSNEYPTIADISYNLINSPPLTTTPSFTLDISGLDYSLIDNTKTYYVRTFVQYESSGSSLLTSYGGGGSNNPFDTAYLGVPVFSDNLTTAAWDPSYSRTNIILDISVNPPLDPSSIYSPGAISSIGIYYDTSENVHNWTGSDPWYENMPSVRRYPQGGIDYIFEGSGNYIDNSMNSLYPWEGTIEASGHILEPNTIYFARAFAINPSGGVYAGKDISFTTLELELPAITTNGVVGNINPFSLTISSTVEENEGDASGTHNWGWVEKNAGVLLLASETYPQSNSLIVGADDVVKTNILTDISGDGITFNITVDNLKSGILYYFRSFISNKYKLLLDEDNYSYGDIHGSYTSSSLPNIIMNFPTNIDTSGCTFNATMYNMGNAQQILECGFIWDICKNEVMNGYTSLKENGDGISYNQQYGWSPSWSTMVPIGNNTLSNLKFDTLSDYQLFANTTYYVTLYILTDYLPEIHYYPSVSFKTKGFVPQCITTGANEIGYTSVHLHGELLSNPPIPIGNLGVQYVLGMGFIWDTSKNFHENGLNIEIFDGSYNIMIDETLPVYEHFSTGGIGPFDISLNMGMIDKQLPDGIYKHFQPNTDYYWAPFAVNLTNYTIGVPGHFKTKDISAVIVDILDGPWLHTYGSRIVEITDVSNGNNGVGAFLYAENHGFVDGQQVFLFAESTNTTFQADEFGAGAGTDPFSQRFPEGKLYYIEKAYDASFQLYHSPGGGLVDFVDISNSDIPVDPNNHMSPITPAGTVTVRLGPLSSGIFDASFSSRTDLVMEISNNTGDYGGTVFLMDSDASGVGNLLKNTGINNLSPNPNFGFCWSSTNEYPDISNCDASSISNWNPPFSDISSNISFNLTNTIYHIRLFGISGELSSVNHTASDTEASGNIYYSDPLAFTSVFHPSGGILDDFGWVWEKDTSNNLQRNVANTFIPPPNADIIYLNHPADVSAVIVDISKTIYSRDMQLRTLDPSSVYYIRAYGNNGSFDTNDNFVQNTNLFDPSYVDTSYNIHSKISNFITLQELLIDASATQDPSSSIFGDISSYKMSLNKVLLEGSCAFENPLGCTKWGFVWDTSSNYNNLVDASRLRVNQDQIGEPPPGFPPELIPGDTFQLAFITMDIQDPPGTTTDIATYNGYVQAQWDNSSNLVPSYNAFGLKNITWNCIGSTETVDASENALVGSGATFKGVYRLDGVKIAEDYGDMWDGELANDLYCNESGNSDGLPSVPYAWTGSNSDGTRHPTAYLGANYGGDQGAMAGNSVVTTSEWISWQLLGDDQDPPPHYYALSEILTVPGTDAYGFWPPNSTDSSGIWVDSSSSTAPGKWPTPYSYNLTGSTESPDEPDNLWRFEINNNKITSLIWYYFRAWGLSKDLTGGEFSDGFAYSKTLKFKAPTACGWTTTKPAIVLLPAKEAKPVENFSYERISDNFTNGKKTGYNIKLSWSDTSYNIQGVLLRRNDVTTNFYKEFPPKNLMTSDIWDASSELYPIIQNLQFDTEYIFTIHTYSHNDKCNVDISQNLIITNKTDYRSYSIPKKIIIPDNSQIDVEKRVFEDACATVPKDALQIQLSQNFNALPKKIKYSFLAKNPTGFGDKSRRNVICGGWLPPGSDPSSGSI